MRPEQQEWYETFQESFNGAIEFAETGDVAAHSRAGLMPLGS